jgi:universal stress protein A
LHEDAARLTLVAAHEPRTAMALYRHLLASVDLDEQGAAVLTRARDVAAALGARLSVLHVVEYVAIDTGEALMAAPPDLTGQLLEQARTRLRALCERCGVPADAAQVSSGGVTGEIVVMVRDLGADLIVIGHHPRSGIRAWFSHTEQDVVQRAPCDVLALTLQPAA